MLQSMTAQHLAEWELIYADDPWDEERMDVRIAQVVATIINVNRKRGRRPLSPYDVMLKYGKQKLAIPQMPQDKKANAERMMRLAKQMTIAMNGKVIENGKVLERCADGRYRESRSADRC
jgi:hypothetical protein